MSLNPREQAFVQYYKATANATKAAIAAGYSAKTAAQAASRLLKKVKVAEALREASEQLAQATVASVEERRTILTLIARRHADSPIPANKAIDTLNKMDGLYVQKVEHSGEVAVNKSRVLRKLSDAVLRDLVSEVTH